MITKVSESVRNNIMSILLVTILIVALTVFCYFVNYSLLIPFFLLFLGLHLKCCGRGTFKSFLNLGLLLTMIMFAAHYISEYTAWPSYYIPVAGRYQKQCRYA